MSEPATNAGMNTLIAVAIVMLLSHAVEKRAGRWQ